MELKPIVLNLAPASEEKDDFLDWLDEETSPPKETSQQLDIFEPIELVQDFEYFPPVGDTPGRLVDSGIVFKNLSLPQINQAIERTDREIQNDQKIHDAVAFEISELRKRLKELDDQAFQTRNYISKTKNLKQDLASYREKLMRDQMANAAMEETARKVQEILQDFPAWKCARDYQRDDVIAAIHAYLSGYTGFMNANDMALGKTFESLVMLKVLVTLMQAEHGRHPRILWITKSSILKTGGTVREAKRWYPELSLMPLNGSMSKKERDLFFKTITLFPKAGVITNYETCRTTEALHNVDWDIIVMDEVHKLKGGANLSGQTDLWKATKKVATKSSVKMVMMLSGTPMVNRPGEMWAYLNIFDQERFPELRKFEREFQAVQKLGQEFKVEIDSEKLLNNALKGRMIRRRKDEVKSLGLPEITPYLEREVLLTHNDEQAKAYNQMRDRFFVWLDDQGDVPLTATAIIAQLTRLRQINIWPVIDFKQTDEETGEVTVHRMEVRDSSKIDAVMEDIESIGDEQFVLFCTFNEPLFEVQRRCLEQGISCEVLHGQAKDMESMETNFQNGITRVICINNAMGEGLNLQKNPDQWKGGASYVGFLDLWYNSARNDQCTDRIYRPGATDPVTVRHYKNDNSVDQFIDGIIEEKYQNITGVSESQVLRPSDWKEFLRKII